eukprot:CAMPEP_0177772006 /NCGR_PEP_ID=MMETSP0491_2-20121128/11961_1 /TAXON_ID=63592 /ORGANISM="Tetraselmis chuii, Strain PLY429" /LENGTH=67 /DNA_ID=CAMNT_0019289725 /DNA_START=220 /DNA_END=423 /DNA_ORIENTATION=+
MASSSMSGVAMVHMSESILLSSTGEVGKDVLPLLTMTACLPTIALLWNHGQRMDLVRSSMPPYPTLI